MLKDAIQSGLQTQTDCEPPNLHILVGDLDPRLLWSPRRLGHSGEGINPFCPLPKKAYFTRISLLSVAPIMGASVQNNLILSCSLCLKHRLICSL